MTRCLEVGHVQTLQADLAWGCLHLLKHYTQDRLRATISFGILRLPGTKEAQRDANTCIDALIHLFILRL